jgi:hypothetical protein
VTGRWLSGQIIMANPRPALIPALTLRWTLAIVAVVGVLAMSAFETRARWQRHLIHHRPLRYDVPFGPAVAAADRIVVRAGGFDCCGKVEGQRTLFTVTDPEEVRLVALRLQFQAITTTNSLDGICMCCGSPGIDWYQGKRRIALTAVQHGERLRWRGFSTAHVLGLPVGYGDAPLTPESSVWLTEWLNRHDVPQPKREPRTRLRRRRERASSEEEKSPRDVG